MNNLMSTAEFMELLVHIFPEIREEVEDEDIEGLVTLQIGCFTRFTQKAIDNKDWTTVKKCFDFVMETMHTVEFRVENSLFISYIGKLKIPENSKAHKMLPEKFKEVRKALEEFYSTPSKNDKLNQFLKDL
jgi:hypothetical protein